MLSESDRHLEFVQVSHSYTVGVLALDGIDVTFGPGITGLVGANGAGKTTMLRIAAGALKPWRGTMLVASKQLYGRERKSALRSISWMPQAGTAPRSLTPVEFVTYVTWLPRNTVAGSRERASRSDAVELGEHAKTPGAPPLRRHGSRVTCPGTGCQCQVLLLDEPSTGLDPPTSPMVRLLAQVADRTVVMSSHILEMWPSWRHVWSCSTRSVYVSTAQRPRNLNADWFLEQTRS